MRTSTPSAPSSASQPAEAAGAPSPAFAPPPGNPRFPLFDGMRGIAVLGILAFHVFELTGRIGLGASGRAAEVAGFQAVIVFFVISGFLLYRPYVAARARERALPATGKYARRRALRILPAYWTILTALAIFPGIIGVFTGEWWRYYGYLQLYSERTQLQGIPVAWTLCVEVMFYVALPLWALAVRRLVLGNGMRGLLGSELLPLGLVAVGGIAVQLAAARDLIPRIVGVTLAGQCTWIVLGMAIAVLSVAAQHDDRLIRRLRALAVRSELCWGIAIAAFIGLMPLQPSAGLAGLIAAAETRQSGWITLVKIGLQAVVAVGLVLPLVFGDQRRGLPRRLLTTAPVAWLGVISYSFYLWHLTVAEFIANGHSPGTFSATGFGLLGHLHTARTFVLYVVTLAITGLLATASYQLIELPFLKRKESHQSRR